MLTKTLTAAALPAAPAQLQLAETDWLGWLPEDWTVRTLYMACAMLGGVVLVLQLLLLMIGGIDGDADFDSEGDAGEGLGLLSIRAVAGFLTFFGLVGLAGNAAGWHPLLTLLASFLAGTAVLFLVAWVMSLYRKLSASGNVDPKNAIGKTAKVYLRIPGSRQGKGKITVTVQGRELQFAATTASGELRTGSEVRIVGMTTEDTFEVEPLFGEVPANEASGA